MLFTIVLFFSALYQCSNGTEKLIYSKSSLNADKLKVTRLGDSTEIAQQLLSPSSSEVTSPSKVTLKLELTPSGRKSNIFISLQVKFARSVRFQAVSSPAMEPIEVTKFMLIYLLFTLLQFYTAIL